MEIGAHILVKGMVQGVGFRYYVFNHAVSLGLKGFVCNRYDGSVEVLAQGNRSLVEELIKELKVGSRMARVTDINVEWKEINEHFQTFDIR